MRRLLALLLAPALLFAGCILEPEPTTPGATGETIAPAAANEPASDAPADSEPPPATPTPAPAPAAQPTPASAPAAAEEPAPAPAPRISVTNWSGSSTGAGLGSTQPVRGLFVGGSNGEGEMGTFSIPADAQGIVLELVWSDAHQDIDLTLIGPDATMTVPPPDPQNPAFDAGHVYSVDAGLPGSPDGHAVIVITDEEALALDGEWSWQVTSKGSANLPFVVYLSVFLDGPPADGYTAAPA